jgi:hypothetical protein
VTERSAKNVALWIVCTALVVVAGACRRSDDRRTLGLWTYIDTNSVPPAILSILLSTNGQGALLAGQKTAFPISFTYARKGSDLRMKGLSRTGALGSLRYQPNSDTLLCFDIPGQQLTLARDHSKRRAAILTAVVGAPNAQQIMQRIAPADLSKAADYLRKPSTNR